MPAKLIIGKVKEHLETFSKIGLIRRLETQEEVRDFINETGHLMDSRPILLYDIAKLDKGLTELGRFLSQSSRMVVCLASYDRFSTEDLSYFVTVTKHPYIYTHGEAGLENIIEFFESQDEHSHVDIMKCILANDPVFIETYSRFSGNPAFTKIIKLLAK